MIRKTLAAAAIAGLLVLGGASAATANTYSPVENISADSATITPGGSTTITATGIDSDVDSVTFVVIEGPVGATLASLVVVASSGVSSPAKSVVGGSASALFTAKSAGDHSIGVYAGDQLLGSLTVTVAAAGTPSAGLPATGGEVPAAALWLGVGAVGIGGIAIAAGVARRRAHTSN